MSPPATIRKINRPKLSCIKCKSRKVKCNREAPCSACVRRGCEDECTYGPPEGFNVNLFGLPKTVISPPDSIEESTVASSSHGSVSEHPRRPRDFDYTGVNLYQSKDEYINFYDLTDVGILDQKTYHQGPLAWSFLQRKDLALSFAWEYSHAMEKRKELMTGQFPGTADAEPEFESTSGQRRENEFNARKNMLNVYAICADDRPALCMRIRGKLPKRSFLKFLLDTYFREVAPFMSFVDPELFRTRIQKIIGPLDSPVQNFPDYECNLHDDLIYLGMLLITLRLGYLSLISHRIRLSPSNGNVFPEPATLPPGGLSAECQAVLDNPVDLSVMELAEECFKKFNLLVKPSLELLQFALMMRVYQKQAPEFGEGLDGGDSQLFTGVLVQMAISIGLNRDPDSNPNLKRLPARAKNIRRHLWFTLAFTDVIEAYSFGNPIACHVQFYDTKPPKRLDESEEEGSPSTVSVFDHSSVLVSLVREVLKHVLDVSGRSKVSEMCHRMTQLEIFMSEQFSPLEVYFNAPPAEDSCIQKERIYGAKISLSIKIFYLAVGTHLFLHYGQIGNQELALFYGKKVICISLLEFLPNIFVIFTKGQDVLGRSSDLVLIPIMLQVTHRVFLNLVSLYIRLRFVRRTWTLYPDSEMAVEECEAVLRGLDTVFNIIQAAMCKLSPRYYYAYKITQTMKSCLDTARDDGFYTSYYPGAIGLRNLPFAVSGIHEINEIIQLGLTKIYDMHKSQAALLDVLKQSCSPVDNSPSSCAQAGEAGVDAPTPNYGLGSDKLGDDNIESFFARVLSEVGETGESWASLADDARNFDFFYNAQ